MWTFKDMIKKRPRGDGDPSDLAPSTYGFQPANASLDISDQARKNLMAFKSYLEQEPTDPGHFYETVAQTFSRSCSTFTQHCLDLESAVADAKSQAADAAQSELSANEVKEQKAQLLAAAEAELEAWRARLFSVRGETAKLERDRLNFKAVKGQVSVAQQQNLALSEQHSQLLAEYRVEVEKTEELSQAAAALEAAIQAQERELAVALAKSEEHIKQLAMIARASDGRNGARAKAKVQAVERNEPFVIEDAVRVSEDELGRLRYMVWTIQNENEQLEAQRDSWMMDFDCMDQENRGLKRIIQQLTDGK
jgi:chromosome segregation ATPase